MQSARHGKAPALTNLITALLFLATVGVGIYLLIDRGFGEEFGLGVFAGLSAMGAVGLIGDGLRNPPMWGGPVFVVLRIISLGVGIGIIYGDFLEYIGWGALWGLLGAMALVALEIIARVLGVGPVLFRSVLWTLAGLFALGWSLGILVDVL